MHEGTGGKGQRWHVRMKEHRHLKAGKLRPTVLRPTADVSRSLGGLVVRSTVADAASIIHAADIDERLRDAGLYVRTITYGAARQCGVATYATLSGSDFD